MKATDVVAFTYRADTYHPECVLHLVKADYPLDYPLASTIAPGDDAESILSTVARSMKLDTQNEYTFDSDVFPKVVFASQVESAAETCGFCGVPIIPNN